VAVLLLASKLVHLPVVSVDSGEDVAEIKDVIYSPEEGRLLGFTLNKRGFLKGRMSEVLPTELVHAVGEAAVMIDNDACLIDPSAASDDVAKPPANRNVLGNSVVTDGGVRLGVVTDLVLELGRSFAVTGYQVKAEDGSHRFVPLLSQLAVSGDVLMVPAATEEFIREELSGFELAVDKFRAQTGHGAGHPS